MSETSESPSMARASSAASSELEPCLLHSAASPPAASSTRATLARPSRHAHNSGVSPASSRSFTSAPCKSSSEARAVWPCSAARCSGVAPNSPRHDASAPVASSCRTSCMSPRVEAFMSCSESSLRSSGVGEIPRGAATDRGAGLPRIFSSAHIAHPTRARRRGGPRVVSAVRRTPYPE
eukprot:scaffold1238_cov116-Isochrysis_galbana.AAC.1